MLRTLAMIPAQLALQLIIPKNVSFENLLSAVDSPLPQLTTGVPDGYTAFPDIGVAYKKFDHKLPWNSARKVCIAEGGYLAVIDSFRKMNHVLSINTPDSWPHVGIHRLYDHDEWTSVKTGLPVAAPIPWTLESQVDKSDWNCLALWEDGRGICAAHCSQLRKFICEIPLSMD